MPGGNWYQYQHLNNGKVEWPTRTTGDLDQGFEPQWVQAWVVQGGDDDGAGDDDAGTSYPGPGPSQSSSESSWSGWEPPHQWTASEPGWANGTFQAGAATGIALMALYNRNTSPPTYEYQWWVKSDLILYED
jgi:hypothetical protein